MSRSGRVWRTGQAFNGPDHHCRHRRCGHRTVRSQASGVRATARMPAANGDAFACLRLRCGRCVASDGLCASELDTGTTTTSSSSMPVSMSPTETRRRDAVCQVRRHGGADGGEPEVAALRSAVALARIAAGDWRASRRASSPMPRAGLSRRRKRQPRPGLSTGPRLPYPLVADCHGTLWPASPSPRVRMPRG